ncbi:MAG: alkaline phosphatase family protein [Polyangiales bacterium]
MAAKHLIIGLDGFDLDVVRALGPTLLPHIHQRMSEGAFSAQKSVVPPATLPNWCTFLTGVDPARHGVFDFTMRKGYSVQFTAGTVRETETIFSRLDRMGRACACVLFPATWPPERLQHGLSISGWDAPVAFNADRSYVWPSEMYDAIQERFGAIEFDTVDEFRADEEDWHRELPDALIRRINDKTRLAIGLLAERDWDVFASGR